MVYRERVVPLILLNRPIVRVRCSLKWPSISFVRIHHSMWIPWSISICPAGVWVKSLANLHPFHLCMLNGRFLSLQSCWSMDVIQGLNGHWYDCMVCRLQCSIDQIKPMFFLIHSSMGHYSSNDSVDCQRWWCYCYSYSLHPFSLGYRDKFHHFWLSYDCVHW